MSTLSESESESEQEHESEVSDHDSDVDAVPESTFTLPSIIPLDLTQKVCNSIKTPHFPSFHITRDDYEKRIPLPPTDTHFSDIFKCPSKYIDSLLASINYNVKIIHQLSNNDFSSKYLPVLKQGLLNLFDNVDNLKQQSVSFLNTCPDEISSSDPIPNFTTYLKKIKPFLSKYQINPKEFCSGSSTKKFFPKRIELFSRFDDGILLDLESWYSVTPEKLASLQSSLIHYIFPNASVIYDAFCGPGGNTIQFTKHFPIVFASDISPTRIICCKHNSQIYNRSNQIQFICGSVSTLLPTIGRISDVIFMAPPWGGIGYDKDSFSLFDITTTPEFHEIFITASQSCRNIVLCLPHSVIYDHLCEIGLAAEYSIEPLIINMPVGRVSGFKIVIFSDDEDLTFRVISFLGKLRGAEEDISNTTKPRPRKAKKKKKTKVKKPVK